MSKLRETRVYNEDGSPAKGSKVTLFRQGFFGGKIGEAYTDSEGRVYFETDVDYVDITSMENL